MKKVLFTGMIVFIFSLFGFPKITYASGTDTLDVYALGPTLDAVINGDTTANGTQAHSVYKLVSLDTTYIYLGQIIPKSDVTVVGVLGTDNRPPTIQPGVLNDQSIPTILFNLAQDGMKAVFKNLYIEDLSTNDSYFHPGRDIYVSANHVKLYVDNVVFDYNHGNVIGYTGNWCDFFITNSEFRNGVSPATWTDSEILAPLWPAVPAVDTIMFKNNTLFCTNAYAIVAKPPVKYIDFSHNNIIYTFLQPFFIFATHSAKINDNVFYGPFVGGETKAEYPWWDQEFSPEIPSVIDLDTMDVKSDSVWDYADHDKANYRMLAEATRNIEVKNNVYFMPKAITDFWTAWNDTANSKDSLYTPGWMNDRTTNMFTDKTHWPGLTASGNIMDVDPGYGSSFDDVLTGGSNNNGMTLLDYFVMIRTHQSPTVGWGYHMPKISGNNWIPEWPLPEAKDMKYTNSALMTASTDGLPVGDLNWFPGVSTGVEQTGVQQPNKFALSNAYPNPFNPSTSIKFSLSKASNVSLKIYNTMGQLVKTIIGNEYKAQGNYEVNINMDRYSSGVYFYTLVQGNQEITKKMILLK